MDFTTTRTKVKAFNSNTSRWQREVQQWLAPGDVRRFRCLENHSLILEDSRRVRQFNVCVAAELPEPVPGSTPWILDNFVKEALFGHAVKINLSTSPPNIEIKRNFWGNHDGESCFEDLVLPAMCALLSQFMEEQP